MTKIIVDNNAYNISSKEKVYSENCVFRIFYIFKKRFSPGEIYKDFFLM